MLVTARNTSNVPVPSPSAVTDAATTTFAVNEPATAITAAMSGKRQSVPLPASRVLCPNKKPSTIVNHGNTRLVSAESAIQKMLKMIMTMSPATTVLRIDCALTSRLPSADVTCVGLPLPCFFRSRSGFRTSLNKSFPFAQSSAYSECSWTILKNSRRDIACLPIMERYISYLLA